MHLIDTELVTNLLSNTKERQKKEVVKRTKHTHTKEEQEKRGEHTQLDSGGTLKRERSQ
jgi:hypothetical protein